VSHSNASFGVRVLTYRFNALARSARRLPCRLAAVALLLVTTEVPAQLPPVGSVDFYGVRKTPIAQVREALGIGVGDSLSALTLLMVSGRLADIPGVMSAAIDPVCCEDGKTMLYVGIAEDGAPDLALRAPPDGASRLAPDVVATGHALSLARARAIMRGISREDMSEGHSLMSDSASRALQLRYVALAARTSDSSRSDSRRFGASV